MLLAAGASTRLGRPKQLLTREGEPLVRRTARLLLATAPSELVVVFGAQAREVAAALGDMPHRAVINPEFAAGLSTSLQRAADTLHHSQAPVLIAVCDQPTLDVSILQGLLHAAQNSAARCAAIAYGARLGVPAVMNADVFRQVHALRGDRGLGGWLTAEEGVARVEVPQLAFDIDTPDDVERARAAGWLD